MSADSRNFFVITGGPGSGKSTLLTELAAKGYACAPEAGRAIIRTHLALDGPALPWRHPALFAELMLMWDVRSHDAQPAGQGPVFFDRGVPDVVGYLTLYEEEVAMHLRRACDLYRYNPCVFIAPPWREIFQGDSERRQAWAEVERTHDVMRTTYEACGYNVVTLPKAPVESRAAFVLEQVERCLRG